MRKFNRYKIDGIADYGYTVYNCRANTQKMAIEIVRSLQIEECDVVIKDMYTLKHNIIPYSGKILSRRAIKDLMKRMYK